MRLNEVLNRRFNVVEMKYDCVIKEKDSKEKLWEKLFVLQGQSFFAILKSVDCEKCNKIVFFVAENLLHMTAFKLAETFTSFMLKSYSNYCTSFVRDFLFIAREAST